MRTMLPVVELLLPYIVYEKEVFCRYRMLSRPYAFNCVLRVRASSEFRVGHSVSNCTFLYTSCFIMYLW